MIKYYANSSFEHNFKVLMLKSMQKYVDRLGNFYFDDLQFNIQRTMQHFFFYIIFTMLIHPLVQTIIDFIKKNIQKLNQKWG